MTAVRVPRSWLIAIALGAFSWSDAQRACAQAVALDLRACAAPAESAVRAIAAVELRGRLLPSAVTDERVQSTVRVRCDERTAELQLVETGAHRSVNLASVPETLRARLLALAVAELATDLPAAASAAQTPAAPAREDTTNAPPASTSFARAPRFTLGLSAGVQLAPLFGALGSLSLLFALRGPLRLYAAFELAQARADVEGGRVRMRTAALRLGPALGLSRPRGGCFIGLGARAARQQFAGESRDERYDARSFSALSLGPSVFGGGQVQLAPHIAVLIEAAATHQLRATRLHVGGEKTRSLSAFEAGLRLGVGASW